MVKTNLILFLFLIFSFGLYADSLTVNIGLNKMDYGSNFNTWNN